MTPKKKTRNSTTLKMERKRIVNSSNDSKVHVAGGNNAGIIVNKQQIGDQEDALFLLFGLSLQDDLQGVVYSCPSIASTVALTRSQYTIYTMISLKARVITW